MKSYCPATMCPLFAPDGSPWTGEFEGRCLTVGCGWWDRGCLAAGCARDQAAEEIPILDRKTYDCPYHETCQWQRESGEHLCPPRQALWDGVDPKSCRYGGL